MADEKDIPKDTPEITEEKPLCGFTVLCGNGGYKLSFLSGEIVQREPSIDEAIVAMKTVILNIETDWVAYKFVSALKLPERWTGHVVRGLNRSPLAGRCALERDRPRSSR